MFNKIFCCLSLLFITANSAFAQTNWKLKTNTDGIKVYASPVPDSKVKALRVECDFKASLSQIVAVLLDVKTCTEWVYHTKSAVLLKQVSPSELYYYSEVSLPWPVQNRDFVAHLMVKQDTGSKVVTVDGPAVSGVVAEKEGIVRISNSKGKWVISPIDHNHIKVVYTLQVDPGGTLPAWLVNLVSSEGPVQSFKQLKIRLTKPELRHASLAFIKD